MASMTAPLAMHDMSSPFPGTLHTIYNFDFTIVVFADLQFYFSNHLNVQTK